MTWQQASYDEVKNEMKPGDVIAFSGKAYYSEVSKAVTRSDVSHVGLIWESSPIQDEVSLARSFPQIIEARQKGIVVQGLDEHITNYPGNIWWCPLSDDSRSKLDMTKYRAFLLEQVGVPFDYSQAFNLRLINWITSR